MSNFTYSPTLYDDFPVPWYKDAISWKVYKKTLRKWEPLDMSITPNLTIRDEAIDQKDIILYQDHFNYVKFYGYKSIIPIYHTFSDFFDLFIKLMIMCVMNNGLFNKKAFEYYFFSLSPLQEENFYILIWIRLIQRN